jgi:signal transduction histidine kinase/HAMP domain-containing protein
MNLGLKDLSIKIKLIAGFGLILGLLVIIGGYTVVSLEKITNRAREVEVLDFSGVELSTAMNEIVLTVDHLIHDYLLHNEPKLSGEIETQINKFYTLLGESKKLAGIEIAKNPEARIKEIEHLEKSFDVYANLGKSIYSSFMENSDEAKNELIARLNIYGSGLASEIEALKDENIMDLSVSLGEIDTMGRKARRANAILIAASILLGAGVAFYLARLILIPLRSLVQGTKMISQGHLSYRVSFESKDELGNLTKSFNWMADNIELYLGQSKEHNKELQRNNSVTGALNSLLNISLGSISLDDFCQHALELIFSISSRSFVSKGIIFLAGDKPEVLVVKAAKGISEGSLKKGAEVPLSKCLSEKAALEKKALFIDANDDRDICLDGMECRSHYCVPITAADNILGVINIQLKENSAFDKKDEDFIVAVANTLAGVIGRKRAEEDLRKAYEELKSAQSQLLQSEKMAAIGQLAGGVAHEINNPLGVILGFAQAVVKRLQPQDPFEMPLRSIEREALRCKTLVQDLLTFSRTSRIDKEETQANEMIMTALGLVFAQAKVNNIELVQELSPDLPKISVNKSQIQQVIINLCNNAMDAMPARGKLTVRAKKSVWESRGVIEIQVEDTGHGIPKEIQGKIFEPFFTTKEVGKGTGLGLALVYEIIQKHQGWIQVNSEVGKGTIFTIQLPAV